GLLQDGEAAWRVLRARPDVDPRAIVLFGRSLGAAVAAELAARVQPAALILETPFTSLLDMGRHHYWFLPVRWLVRSRYDTLGAVRRVRVPVLVLHGDADEIVPFDMGEQVFAAASEPKAFYRIAGASHNDTYLVGGKAYLEAFRAFLATALPGSRVPG
ncbi:MAG TPA: alpha/beta hydrolase, partial [Candidatus Methylomirabilis sp.]|nr:alpha/beta hydrolase [Candidatus Methylomirabilis sp.]